MAGLALAASCLALALPARAGDAGKAAARGHFDAATRLYDIHEYADALKEYKAAYLGKPDPAFLFHIGQCYEKLGRPDEAREFFLDFLKKAPSGDPNRPEAEARMHPAASIPPTPPVPAPAQYAYPAPVYPAPAAAPIQQTPAPVTYAASAPDQPAGVDLSAPAAPAQASTGRPFYGTWWFWTGVGAVVVVGTVTALLLSSGGGGTNVATTLGTQKAFP